MTTQDTDTEKIQSNFESYAQSFDQIYESANKKSIITHWVDKQFRKSMFFRFQETLKNISPSEIKSVLDIGCGSGRYCIELLKMGKRITGIDIAEEMLKIARKNCEQGTQLGTAIFISGNYLDIELEEKFDATILMGLFDYVKSPKIIFEKIRKETNQIILASFPKAGNFLNHIRKIRYYLFKNCPLYFYTKLELEELFKSIGFTNVSIIESDREYYVKITLDNYKVT